MNNGGTQANRPKEKEVGDYTLYPRDCIVRLYVSRKEGGREVASIEDCIDASIQRF